MFNLDVSFYVFKLAFIKELNQILIGVIIAFAILTLLYYAVLLSVRTPQMFEEKEEPFEEEPFTGGSDNGPRTGFDNVTDMFGKFGEAFTLSLIHI